MSEGQSSAYEEIRGKKSLREILATAAAFERSARDFYSALAPRVSKNIRWLVADLAAEEQRHLELFSQLAERTDLEEQIAGLVDTPRSDRRFSDCIQVPELGEKPDDQSVLQYALGREQAAMEQYHALADATGSGPIQDLFRYLANEETEHKAELEKLYYEVVHSGGV
jgi:rubrerythrin